MLKMKPTVLIVDDEPNINRVAKLIINPLEYNVITAENGIDAYDKILKGGPDIIFSDILMPKCDGFELCSKVKSDSSTSHIPFIFLTALDKKQFKLRSDDVSADDYLSKPFTADDIISKISEWIDVKKLNVSKDHLSAQVEENMDENRHRILFGIPDLDQQLSNGIYPESFILLKGKIGSGKTNLTRQFILDGVKKQQQCLLVSFEPMKKKMDLIYSLNEEEQQYLHICEAAQWATIGSKPWRNIDFIYDYIADYCNQKKVIRIVIDSLSHGHAFWSTNDILKLIDLCRLLKNFEDQVILWTLNTHTCIEKLEFYLEHVMDICVSMQHKQGAYLAAINYSKWQAFNNKEVKIIY